MHSCHSLLVAQRRINNVWPKPRSLPRRLYLPAAVQTLMPLPSSRPLVYSPSWSPSLPTLLLLSPSALLGLAACAPSVHHPVLFTFPPPLSSFPALGSSPLLLHLCLPTAPPPPSVSEPSLFLAHRPHLPPSPPIPPAPPRLPSSYLSRHCRRAPGVPQNLFSTIKLLSLPLPGSCKNNLG